MSDATRLFDRRLSRRDFVRGATAAAGAASLGSLLAACSAGVGAGGGKAVTITYWDWWVSQAPWVDNEIKLFQQANPGIRVRKTTTQFNQYDNLVGLSFRDAKPPDVFMVPPVLVPFNKQIQQGWIKPLKQAGDPWTKRFPTDAFTVGSNIFNGKVYSAPQAGNAASRQLYVSVDVFKAAGLTNADGSLQLPKTWDDVTRMAQIITKKGNGDYYGLGFGNGTGGVLAFWLDIFARGAGSTGGDGLNGPGGLGGFDYQTGKFSLGSDRNYEDVVRLMLEWKSKGLFWPNSMSTGDEAERQQFERGKIGMMVSGVWVQPEWRTDGFPNFALQALIGPTETPKAFYYHQPGGFWIAISAQTKHADESWAWLDWLYSVDAGRRWTQVYNEDLSVFPSVNDPSKIKFRPFADYVASSKLNLLQPAPAVRNPDTGSVVIQLQGPTLGDVMTGLMSGQLGDIHAALSDYDGRATAALDQGIKAAQAAGARVSLADYTFPDWDPTKDYQTRPAS
jgi:ABC-type glycerol-3-phosphate transport system substrate-binding protein